MRHRLRVFLTNLTKRKSFRIGVVSVFALALVFVPTHLALAATPGWLNTLLSILAAIAMTVAEVIGNLVIIVLDVTIPVMQYQGFTTSDVVIAGWAIVRDVVNMFFVVVLIIIAMGTIFGSSKFQWKQNVPKLMLFALLINFSKTLCGLMIDFSQVIMLTFANALKDIAGGNFIQLLGLTDIFKMSEQAETLSGSVGTGAFDLFAAAGAAVIMMVWVLAVVVMLLFILVYRVVMLWVLIVIAPLAWFTSAVPLKAAQGSYEEWWKNFICYTSVGPVIVFFLWLTLAVAGSGVIASTDSGFSSVTPAGAGTGNFVTQIFEMDRFMSFVIGMAMLMAGFDAAGKVCAGVKGGVNSILSKAKNPSAAFQSYKQAGKYGMAAGQKMKSAGSAVGSYGAGVTGAMMAGGGLAGGIAAMAPTKSAAAKRAEGKRNLAGVMPGRIADSLHASADASQADIAASMKKDTEEKFKDASPEREFEALKRMAAGNVPVGDKQAYRGLLAKALKDPKMREKMEAGGIMGTLVEKELPELKKQLKGTKEYDAITDFEKGRPDLMGKVDRIDSKNVGDLDAAAYTNNAVREQLKTIDSDIYDKNEQAKNSDGSLKFEADGTTKVMGRHLTEYEAAARGKKGKAKKDAILGKEKAGYNEALSDVNLKLVPLDDLVQNPTPALVGRRQDLAEKLMSSDDPAIRAKVNGDPALRKAAMSSALGVQFDSAGRPMKMDAKNQAVMNAAVKKDPNVLGNIPYVDMAMNPELTDAVAGSLDKVAVQRLAKQYEKASPDERTKMDNGILKISMSALTATRNNNASGHQTQADVSVDFLETKIEAVKKEESGNALQSASYTVKVVTEQLSTMNQNLIDARDDLEQAQRDADRERQDELEVFITQVEQQIQDANSRLTDARATVSRGGRRA